MSGETKSRLLGLGAAILLFPVYYWFQTYGDENRGFVVVCVASVLLGAIYARREVATKPWFLITIAIFGIGELLTALSVPLPPRIPGAVMIPISLVNVVLLLAAISGVEKLLAWKQGQSLDLS